MTLKNNKLFSLKRIIFYSLLFSFCSTDCTICKTYVAQTHWIWSSLTWGFDCDIVDSELTQLSSATSSAILFPSAQQYQKALHQSSKKASKPAFSGLYSLPLFLGTQEHREVKEVTKIHISISTQQPWTLTTTFVSCVPVTFLYSSSVFLHTFPPVLIHHSKQLPTSPVLGVSLMHIGVKEVLFSAPRIQRVQTWEPPPPAKQTHILHQHLPILAKKTDSLGANGHYFRNQTKWLRKN